MERDSKKFKVYSSKTGKCIASHPDKNVKGGSIISADFIEVDNTRYVATCQNNRMINFWDSMNYMHRDRLPTADI